MCTPYFTIAQLGINVTKWLGLLLFLAPIQEGFFKISRFIPDGIFLNTAQSSQKIKLLLVVFALVCNLVWFSRTLGEFFLSEFMYIVPVTQIDSKNILRMFSRMRPDRRIALILSERASFLAYSALSLNKFYLVWIEIFQKILPEAELKIVTNSVYLIIWSRGFPTLYIV